MSARDGYRVTRRERLAVIVAEMLESWSLSVGGLDVGETFAEYLEIRPGDRAKIEDLARRETQQSAAALRQYFEEQLVDTQVVAELDRLDEIDSFAQAPLRAHRAPGLNEHICLYDRFTSLPA